MINHDRQIKISTAGTRKATSWPVQELWWSDFINKLEVPVRGQETLMQYLKLPKSQQDDLKDVGGFVGGQVTGQRKAKNIAGRDLITLDLDNIPSGETDSTLKRFEGLGCGYAVYSTRKHEAIKPRLRVILPLSRTVTADEYEPIARKIAGIIGIELCDQTTFQASRLMYWPSCSSDSQYVFHYSDKPMLSADGILQMYGDWRDVTQWPQVPGASPIQKLVSKQGDPETKTGVVGAFCRQYDIYKAMEQLIPGEYTACDVQDRYTYAGGSTTGGAVVYEGGKFLYSHHATDPASEKLCNSFDLVRLHKFHELDEEAAAGTPTNRLPSYTAMMGLAKSDKAVMELLKQEKYESAVEDFGGDASEDMNWVQQLELNNAGNFDKTSNNVVLILKNDPKLKGKFAFDEFANRSLILGAVPWDETEQRRQHTDNDDAGIRWYLETVYKITGKEKIYDALALVAREQSINNVKDYLDALVWDGEARLDTLLSDYLGAEDNAYTRAVIRKSLAAAVARVYEPGKKYDYMSIFAGPQGIGKSTFLAILGRHWYSDSLGTFEGKEAAEMIQGTWINEIGELNGMSKSETNAVKLFLSKRDDIYREPYGRKTVSFPRRCVFFGTTNDSEFLKDKTGNRRFWPVDVGLRAPYKNVFVDLEKELDQIWAEAVTVYHLGEPLYLQGEAEKLAKEAQTSHQEDNVKEGMILEYLCQPLPENWNSMDLGQRRMHLNQSFGKTSAAKQRKYVCAAEIWCECFGKSLPDMRKTDSREINSILANMEGLEKLKTPHKYPIYGSQRGYEAKTTFFELHSSQQLHSQTTLTTFENKNVVENVAGKMLKN